MPLQHRYLFIGGLHRSGTSLVARMAAGLPGAAGIEDAPVPENEGAYLQGGIPHDALSGRPMHFATDPAQHLTEAHPLNRLGTRNRIEADWSHWFRPDALWRVEKSPVNLTRTRLLQQLFPLSQFVIVLRHPEAIAAAIAKWVDAEPDRLIEHWIRAHEIVADDIRRLHSVLVLRYEDVIAAPDATRAALAAFIEVEGPVAPFGEPLRDGNADYPDAPRIFPAQIDGAARWGYGSGLVADEKWGPVIRHPLRSVRERTDAALVHERPRSGSTERQGPGAR